jgi:hypothetical protein
MMTMSGSSGQSVQRRMRPEDEATHITVSSIRSFVPPDLTWDLKVRRWNGYKEAAEGLLVY